MALEFKYRVDRDAQRPEMFEAMAERMPNPDSALTASLVQLTRTYREFNDQRNRIGKDEILTAGGKIVKIAKAARSKLVPMLEKLDDQSKGISAEMDKLVKSLGHAFDPPNKGYEMCMRYREIREHFRSLKPGERAMLLQQVQDEGDEDALIALASVQAFVSGLPKDLHNNTREVLIQMRAPDQAATLKALGEQKALADQFKAEMVASVGVLVNFQRADEIIAAAKEDAAA